MKHLALLLDTAGALALTGCQDGAPKAQTTNSGGERTTFFYDNGEVEGCRLFYVNPAMGSSFNLAVCNGGSQTSTKSTCGKGCTREDTAIQGEVK